MLNGMIMRLVLPRCRQCLTREDEGFLAETLAVAPAAREAVAALLSDPPMRDAGSSPVADTAAETRSASHCIRSSWSFIQPKTFMHNSLTGVFAHAGVKLIDLDHNPLISITFITLWRRCPKRCLGAIGRLVRCAKPAARSKLRPGRSPLAARPPARATDTQKTPRSYPQPRG